nr:MAG TPA: type I neck protein [Caudoviricetes sp.]
MKSAPMQSILSQYASDIQARCGDGYVKDIHVGKNRANATVSAKTYKAKKDNMKNNTLLKAVN